MRVWGALVVAAAVAAAGLAAAAPERLHIIMQARSDAAPFWSAYLMELRRDSGDWELRWVRVAPTSANCPRLDVKAASRPVAANSARAVFKGVNPCAVSPKQISRVYPMDQLVDLMDHPVDYFVVADCLGETRILELPHLAWEREKALEKRGHVVARLRALYWDLGKAAGRGDQSPFADIADDKEDFRLQQQGEAIVPELRSGRLDAGPAFSWARALGRYAGAKRPATLRPTPRLVREASSEGVDLVGPDLAYPPLAQMARIQGRVSVGYELQSRTGAVRVIEGAATGHPLLVLASAASLETWRATNYEETGTGPFTAVIEYDLEVEACQIGTPP